MPHTDYAPVLDCDTALPPVSSDDCSPQLELSELTDLYFCEAEGDPFTDVTDPAEWADRLNDAGTVPSGSTVTVDEVIRHLPILGDYPAPAETPRDISGGREQFVIKTSHTINFDVDDVSTENYKLAQFTQSMTRNVRAWVKTKGGKMIGGNAGIVGKLKINPVFARGTDSIIALTGTLSWTSAGGGKKWTPDLHASVV